MPALARAGAQAPSADNSQPCQFAWNGRSLDVVFDRERGQGKLFGASGHATLLCAGCVTENLVQASDGGLDLDWPDECGCGNPYFAVRPDPLVELPGAALRKVSARHTNRFAYRIDAVPARFLAWIESQREGRARAVVLPDASRKREIARLARLAGESRFLSRELHEWLIGSLRFTPQEVARGDGLDVTTLHLPPGGRWFLRFISPWNRMAALNRVGVHKLMAAAETLLLREAPALVCVVGGSGPRAAIDAGRLLERIWIELNVAGIAVHPYYVITDQLDRVAQRAVPVRMAGRIGEIGPLLAKLLELDAGETLHMLLRIGYPVVGDPPRSRRLPLDRVFTDLTSMQRDAVS